MQRFLLPEGGLERIENGGRAGWLCRALDSSVACHAGRIVEGGLRHRQHCLPGLVVPVVLKWARSALGGQVLGPP